MRTNENIHLISSTLKTVASENFVTSEELEKEDKSLEEVLNEEKENTEQGERK